MIESRPAISRVMDERSGEFDRLYDRYKPYVDAFARRRCDLASVDDVVSDVFTTAWRRLDDVPADALPWLYRTAHNALRTRYRTNQRWALLSQKLAAIPAERFGADPAVMAGERQSVLDSLASLSDEDREVILLVAWEGLSHAEIATVLEISSGTVGVRLHRARKRLRTAIDDYEAQRSPTDG